MDENIISNDSNTTATFTEPITVEALPSSQIAQEEPKKRGRKKGSTNKPKIEESQEELDLNKFTETASVITNESNENMENFTKTLNETISKIEVPVLNDSQLSIGKNNSDQILQATKFVAPPNNWFRNCYGLLNHVNYIFNEDGSVDYRRLVKKEYFVPNKSKTSEKDISKLEDKDLLILLAGIKEVAQIRGYTSVDHQVISASPDSVFVKTTICWLPNYETNMRPVCFSALADATLANTQSFAKNYLMSIAENRGFVRAVRNFLRIHVLGADEIGTSDPQQDNSSIESPISPINILNGIIKKHSINFDKLKAIMHKKGIDGALNWTDVNSIPTNKIFDIINKINEILETANKK